MAAEKQTKILKMLLDIMIYIIILYIILYILYYYIIILLYYILLYYDINRNLDNQTGISQL